MENNPSINVVDIGHKYVINTLGEEFPITFIKKKPKNSSNELELVHNGITNEVLIDVLMHRIKYLNTILYSPYNDVVLEYLKMSLEMLKKRTEDRVSRKVEGTHVK